MRVSLPMSVTSQIAADAARIAKGNAVARGWKSSASLEPAFGTGYVGIKTSRKYYLYQELGTKPYLMKSLEGKTIPMPTESGTKFIKVKGVGEPGYVTLPDGSRVFREQKWRHPGLKPTNLMGSAIKQAKAEDREVIKQFLRQLIGLES